MKKKWAKIFNSIGIILLKIMDDIFLGAGIILISIGVFKIYIPAGYIISGICLAALAFFIGKKGGE